MEEYIVLKNPAIFDGVNEELIRGKSLVISGGKISLKLTTGHAGPISLGVSV